MNTITIGVDLAKTVFSVYAMDRAGHVLKRQDLRREPFGLWPAELAAGTVVAMETCRMESWVRSHGSGLALLHSDI
jgi:transposase